MRRLIVLIIYTIVFVPSFIKCNMHDNKVDSCELPENIIQEIQSYEPVVKRIISSFVDGEFKGSTYNYLSRFVDIFGNRIAGSKNLENAIDYMLKKSVDLNLENVHGEVVTAPHWVRGKESAMMLEPRYQNLAMLGLGSSIGTPKEGLRAEIVVVSSFEELEKISTKVKDKIVVFNEEYTTYGETVQYRDFAADRSSAFGAVATLVRSVTPFSLNTPHTGWQQYSNKVPKIPTACITIADANMLHRMYLAGDKIVVEIKMDAQTLPSTKSRNVIVDIEGKSAPEKIVVVSGHIDSWDVGQGAMDDGAGAFLGWNSLVVLKALGLRPKRTLRSIFWTAEEEGLVGAFEYAKRHKNESENLNFIMESDEGTFAPTGLLYAGPKNGECVLQEVLKLFTSLNATKLEVSNVVGSDIMIWTSKGIPGASLLTKNEKYFWYHHTNADTMDIEDTDILDQCTAIWASVAYIIADISVDMRNNDS